MEKVKLTKEQAEAIKQIGFDTHFSFDSFLNSHAKNEESERNGGESWTGEYYPLNTLSVSDLAKALYIGYEVVEKFKVGDKVMVNWVEGEPTLQEVEKIQNGHVYIITNPPIYNSNPSRDIIRHATHEEIYWLETLGRKRVGDFRIGDAVLTLEGAVVRITTEYTLAQTDRTYNEHPREIVGIYPEESFKQFSQEESK